jgi:membrane protease YdiL (CAAX protease family)
VYKFFSGVFKHPLFAPLVIYTLFFLPDAGSVQNLFDPYAETALSFSAFDELFQICAFYIPALAIVLYFCFQQTPCPLLKQCRFTNDTAVYFKFAGGVIFCAAVLMLIGGAASLAESFFAKAQDMEELFTPFMGAPDGVFAVSVMAASCVVAAYFEESFFRVLLYRGLLASSFQKITAVLTVNLLFAICHAWQGPWGVAGAFLSGIFLTFIFDWKKSLHLIALSHALYNITAYLLTEM